MELILAYDRQEEVRMLFLEYTRSILTQGEEVRRCLEAQHYGQEMENLTEKYGPPGGRLYLAVENGRAVGCGALTRNSENCCEIKRLYVRPEGRGLGVGRTLVRQLIQDAREMGCRFMRLDTFPFMETAIGMYRRLGFYPISRYNDNPAETAIFLQLDLQNETKRGWAQ